MLVKLKKLFLLTCLGILLAQSFAQNYNANPDTTGPVWIVGDIPEYSAEYIQKLNNIPELILDTISAQTTLPDSIDNSQNKYMRPIFPQMHASCSPAAGVGYNFTYEINRLRNIDVSSSDDSSNFYPTHFTYNFLNMGQGSMGCNIFDCWDIVKEQGCPTVPIYGGMFADSTHWMSGYEKYDTSFYNRLESYSKITITDSSKLNILKHWLSDHNEGDSIGGLANFIAHIVGSGYLVDQLQESSPGAGKSIILRFPYYGDTAKHALTIVGFNDSIRYDYNDDDTITNNIDINNDDTVDIRDWEFGAVKVANSWGITYPTLNDSGFVYVPYRLLAESFDTGGIIMNQVYVVHLDTSQTDNTSEFILKLKLQHPLRNKLNFELGYADKSSDTIPDWLKQNFPFSSSYNGPFPMCGYNNNNPIEIEFDFSYYFPNFFDYDNYHFGKVFIDVYEATAGHAGDGAIQAFSLVDYRWNETFELSYDNLPDSITSTNDSIVLGIEYDLIPFEMDTNILNPDIYKFDCNKICRRNCEADSGASVRFGKKTSVDFYSGSLVINDGASLTIEDSITLFARTGSDSLIIYGDIEIGHNVSFIADEDASLVIDIRNSDLELDINNAYFENITFAAYNDSLSIDSCRFVHSDFDFYRTNDEYLVITNSVFDTTYFNATIDEKSSKDNGNLVISDSKFVTNKEDDAININVYENFQLLRDSIVFNYGDGISLVNSGSSTAQTSKIKDCYIYFRGNASEDTSRGINIYHSYASLENNHIFDCTYGVACLNRSNVSLIGDESAEEEGQTQQIVNNEINQVYALEGSFPYEFEYNAIYNESSDDSLVYYNTTYIPSGQFLDVINNYWGEGGLDITYGLIPSLKYYWDPVWDPWGYKNEPQDKLLFYAAKQHIEDGEYKDAEENFKEIIEDYSNSKYVNATVKELLVLKRIYDQDFAGLQSYLDSVPTLWDDTITANITDHVSNWCNIEKGDYESAITWFEDQIENPISYEDSICAIIDLAYTYTLYDTTSNKSIGYIGKYPQFRPTSIKSYEKSREKWEDLLFRHQSITKEKSNNLQPVTWVLQQNYPNPAFDYTTINYTLQDESHVLLQLLMHRELN